VGERVVTEANTGCRRAGATAVTDGGEEQRHG
jgi:hypothetical protein